MWWLVAHAVHLTLIVLGTIGVVALLFPQWQESRAFRTAWRPPPVDEHRQRVEALRESARSGQLATLTPEPARVATVARDSSTWRVVAVVSGLAAAGVHAEVFPEHLEEGLLLGTFFCVLAIVQVAWALLLARRATRGVLLVGIIGNAAVILLWAVTRTLGLPFGLIDGTEAVGGWDVASGIWELCAITACVAGLSADPATRALTMGRLRLQGWAWLAASAAVLTLLAVAVPVE